ncbi:MAG TPA: RecQ family ATP-dependent DNA helicase [Gaiellaceae bacterium]|nr:RecQ family ATP-dependent DNA helicase [Gaiellaceae bacterium]
MRTPRTSRAGAEAGTESAQGSPAAAAILARLTDLASPLRDLFGFDAFRPGQEDVVRAAIAGRDTLALMPTGSGKSLTYQLAAMLRPEPTLVLSPLIALMKDQVDKLPPEIAATATFVNSSLSTEETASRLAAVSSGETRLVYAAPERLRQVRFVELLAGVGIGLVVVDEVHCVSMWGHDFRPDYLFIRRGLDALGDPTLLGMTATATPETARDIGQALGRSLDVVHTSVMRPNLRYDVEEVANAEDRIAILVERLRALRGGSAIVYARSRRSTEELARVLSGHGFRAEHYHAGLEAQQRTRVQDDFVAGKTQAVVATTAFGMGIDKPDVRLVCLVNYPDSLEGYVQMIGRAGRDGEPSQTLLLASPSDATALRRFAVSDVPTASELRSIYRALREASGLVDPDELSALVPERDARVLVGMLEQAGLLERSFDEGRLMRINLTSAPADARERVEALLDRASLVAESRADRIVAFAETRVCRHEQVAAHFGEAFVAPCGNCDVCVPSTRGSASISSPPPPLPEDIGEAIVDAVASLTWPLGRRSLVATLRGSLKAPPSARRSAAYRMLAAATDGEVRRWVQLVELSGALVEVTTPDGFRVLQVDRSAQPPQIRTSVDADVDEDLVSRLRSWRLERSQEDAVPAYVVLHDSTLRELAALRPQTMNELAGVKGFGPVKLERYGDDLLAVIAAA